jgi:hypothetical protein
MGEDHSHSRHRRRDLLGAASTSLTQEVSGQLERPGSDEVADHPELGALLADIRCADRVPFALVPATICQLSAIIVRLAARQMEAQSQPNTSPSISALRHPSRREWLTIEEASSQYPLSKSWLYRNGTKLGFAKKMGAKVLVSVRLLDRYLTEGRNR